MSRHLKLWTEIGLYVLSYSLPVPSSDRKQLCRLCPLKFSGSQRDPGAKIH